jgi:carbon-monoxide dehydrogenase medium subunit
MHMPHCERYTPETLDEVAALLLAADGEAHPVVMGTTFLAQANGAAGPTPIVVDLARVPELNRLEYDERNGMLLGAALPLVEPLRFPPLHHAYAILADGICRVPSDDGGVPASLGGCLDSQTPSADLALPLICLGASVAIFGPHGWSEMSAEALCARWPGTALQRGEFIVDVRLPARSARSGGAYVHSAPGIGAREAVAAGVFLVMEEDLATCCGVRVALWAEAVRPLRALDAERFLQGRHLDAVAVGRAGELVMDSAWPWIPGSAGDRRRALRDVASEAIHRALDRARSRPHPGEGSRS